jgi:DNA-binding transcriptional regulator YdaS (Cro superfamily)
MDLQTYLDTPEAPTVAELAKLAGIKHPAQINQWRNPSIDRRPGYEHAAAIERATNGACPCEDLNPALNWLRLPDPEYPFHKDGRPVIDPTKQVQEA